MARQAIKKTNARRNAIRPDAVSVIVQARQQAGKKTPGQKNSLVSSWLLILVAAAISSIICQQPGPVLKNSTMKFSIITPSFRNSCRLKLCIAFVVGRPGVEIKHVVQDSCSDNGTRGWPPHDRSHLAQSDVIEAAIGAGIYLWLHVPGKSQSAQPPAKRSAPMPVHAFLLARYLRLSEHGAPFVLYKTWPLRQQSGTQPVCRAPMMFGHHAAGRNFTGKHHV